MNLDTVCILDDYEVVFENEHLYVYLYPTDYGIVSDVLSEIVRAGGIVHLDHKYYEVRDWCSYQDVVKRCDVIRLFVKGEIPNEL
ncbi:MAG: hypothetical protein ACRCVU_09385 [Flavobacterium sp.]